jgi:predicted O-linked N-acetylglucosamine transferase (SPINDLY family)
MLGIIHGQLGKYDDAEAYLYRAIALNPENFDAHVNYGSVLYRKGLADQALASAIKALSLYPDHASALLLAGNAYARLDRLTEAEKRYTQALLHHPSDLGCRGNLANVLAFQGRTDEAIEHYRRVLKSNPKQPGIHSNLLLCLHYNVSHGPDMIYREHLAWAATHTRGIATATAHNNAPRTDRVLRIGYVTPDLRGHSVAYFLEPILAHHDNTLFDIYCYVDTEVRDAATERLWKKAGTVRDTSGLTDSEAAELIHEDRIDILVDLAGHTENNRLLVFAHRPAPVQMTYLGYPDTSGMKTIDYRITDQWADPPGTTEHWHSEKLLRLDQGFLCFLPPEESPPVSPLPAGKNGYLTFGSFNVQTKITPEMLAIWAQLLHKVPQSRIFVKNKQLTDKALQKRIAAELVQFGIEADRIELQGKTSKEEHMASYAKIDIALDSFPYNGTTTTCDTLWMGIPVVSLAGHSHVSRVGVSLLTAVGLESLITDNEEKYISCAVTLAEDFPRLSRLRKQLRDTMRHSRLCDGASFTAGLESMYRSVWKDWCDKARSLS